MMTLMDNFFKERIKRSGSPFYSLDLTSVSTYSSMEGWGQWSHNRDDEPLKQTNIAMITDKDGIPVMFRMLPGSIADMSILKAIVTDMQHLGCNSRLILDRGFESAENIAEIMNLGIDFTIPSHVTAEPIKKLWSLSIPEMKLTKAWTYHEGHACKYAEFEVGVITIKDEMKYLIHLPSTHKGAHENNELFNQAKKLKAFVVYDGKKASDDFQNVMKMIHEMELKFENTKVQNPEKNLSQISCIHSKIFGLYG